MTPSTAPSSLHGSHWARQKIQVTDHTWAESSLLRAPTMFPLTLLGVIGWVLLIAGQRTRWWQPAQTRVAVLLVALAFAGVPACSCRGC